ncbi:MAG: glycosyltransferase family 4 protein [Rhodospirillales bacterium]|nr:glycosyltransferase family 4 protein [Rhodospirillales bacterium]
MKILINALSARRGGIITYTRNLMRSFKERKIDAVFALQQPSILEQEDAKIESFPVTDMRPLTRAIWEQTYWRKTVKRIKPDVLFSSANFGLIAPPVPQVLLIREGGLFDPDYLGNIAPALGAKAAFSRKMRRDLILASARASEVVMTPTDAMTDLLGLWAEDVKSRVEKNIYGTPLDHFVPAKEPQKWRENDTLKILMVSAYYPHKQPGLIAEAVRLLNESGLPTKFTLTMTLEDISESPGGAKDEFLIRKALERGDTQLLGHVEYENLPSLYHDHHLFVTASLSETFGHPLVEAMAAGIPIVAADTPVHREVCKDAADYFHATSSKSLMESIIKLDADPSLRDRLHDRANIYPKNEYSWDGHVDRLLDCFERAYKMRKQG